MMDRFKHEDEKVPPLNISESGMVRGDLFSKR